MLVFRIAAIPLLLVTIPAMAEIFIYQGADGSKIISDHPLKEKGIRLIAENQSL